MNQWELDYIIDSKLVVVTWDYNIGNEIFLLVGKFKSILYNLGSPYLSMKILQMITAI